MEKNDLQISGIGNSWDKTWDDLQIGDSSFADFDSSVQMKYQSRLLAPYPEKKVLEVGSGSGYFSLQMAKAGAEVTLLDISPKALSVCAHLFRSSKVPCAMVQANGLQLPFASNSFDVVWNGGVIEHFYDEGKIRLLSEMQRATKPGGIVFVSCPNKWDLPFALAKKIGDIRGDWAFGYEELISPPRLKNLFCRYTATSIRDVVQEAGFQVQKTTFLDSVSREWFIVFKPLRWVNRLWSRKYIRTIFNAVDSTLARRGIFPASICIQASLIE